MVVGGRELIDTLWNVNNSSLVITFPPSGELIDTLWNVNNSSLVITFPPSGELIDTLWNVNFVNIYKDNIFLERINRYIMECKY